MAGNLPRVGVTMTAENADLFVRQMRDSTNAVQSFGRDVAGTGPQFSAFEQIASGAFQRVGHMVTDFALDASRSLIAFGADSVKMAGDFEATLNSFASVSGPLDEAGLSLDDFKEKFLQLGADTKYSAQEAADAGVELVKAGVDIEDVMSGATEATLNLAAAGGVELVAAAEIVGKQLGVWGKEGVSAAQATDLIAQAANASSVDVDELALGLYNANAAALTAGLGYEELVTTMALIAPGFASAAEGGNSLKNMLLRLQPSTDPAAQAMEALGLYTEETGSAFYDAQGEFVGMEQAAGLLQEAFIDLSEADRIKNLQLIFGNDAMGAAKGLIDAGIGGYNEMTAAMLGTGTAAEQAAKKNQGFNAMMETLGGSIDTVKIRLGDLLIPTLTVFVSDTLVPAVDAVDQFIVALTNADDPLAMLGTLAANAGAMIAAGIPMIRQAFLDWALAAATWILDSMPMLLANLGTFLQGAITWAVDAAFQFGDQMLAFGQQIVAWIAPRLPELGNQLGEFFNRMVNWVVDSLPGWGERLAEFGKKAATWVLDALPGLMANLGEMGGNLLGWLVRTIGEITPKLLEMAGKFIAWVATDVIPELPAALETIWNALFTFLATTIENVLPELQKLAERFTAWVSEDVLPMLPGVLDKIWEAIKEWVGKAVGWAGDKLKELGTAIVDGILSGLGNLADALLDSLISGVTSALDGVKSFFGIQSPSKVFRDEVGVNIMDGIVAGVEITAPSLTDALVGGIDTAMQAGDLAAMLGGQQINATLGSELAQAQSTIAALQASMGQVGSLSASIGRFGGSFGDAIRPPASSGQQFASQVSTTFNGPSITYNPTYNSPAPPPAMSYAAITTMAGV